MPGLNFEHRANPTNQPSLQPTAYSLQPKVYSLQKESTINAEIIAIGDELTSGQRVDTNSAWLSQRLGDLGIRVLYHTTCADDLAACTSAFAQAMERVDVVVSTGGLGPTADDLTRDAIAGAVQQPLELRAAVLSQIEELYRRRGRSMPSNNRVQAMFPAGSEVIPNPHGTAPGIFVDWERTAGRAGRTYLFAVPGVPAEMRQMWDGTVEPRLRAIYPAAKVIRHHELKCFGVGESQLEQMLPDLIRRGRVPSVGITVHRATITLRVTAEADCDAACRELMEPTIQMIKECLGDLVFGEQGEELQHAVLRSLWARGESLATAEIGTAGRLSHWLQAASDEAAELAMAESYRGGLVVPSRGCLDQLIPIANRPPDEDPASYWQSVAQEVRMRFKSDYGLVISEFPRQRSDSTADRCWIALATSRGSVAACKDLAGHPDIVADRCAKQALDLLRAQIRLSPDP